MVGLGLDPSAFVRRDKRHSRDVSSFLSRVYDGGCVCGALVLAGVDCWMGVLDSRGPFGKTPGTRYERASFS